jgi:hypothetical protein
MARGAHFRKWNGPKVVLATQTNVAKALGKFGLVAEGFSKKELTKGHGVITGTLRRSIHTAQPGYDWAGDNVPPEAGTPELGGANVEAAIEGSQITLQLGSGLQYALPVHQGHSNSEGRGNFSGYHFLVIGLDKAKALMPNILKEYQLK